MRYAKSGEWWETQPQRAFANNSVGYTEKPEMGAFMREWQALYESKSGERGIFNRVAAKKACEAIGRDSGHEFGTNPCLIGSSKISVKVNGKQQIVNMKDLVDLFHNEWKDKNILVWSYDEKTNKKVWKEVTDAFKTKQNADLVRVTDTESGKKIICTPDHKIYTRNRGWVKAQYLEPDDTLVID